MHRTTIPAIFKLALSLLLLTAISHAQTAVPQISLPSKFPLPESDIQLVRGARPNAYFDAVGRRAGLLGTESGRFESWIYPLKLFYGARITIAVDGQDRIVEFGDRIERVIHRPESTTIVAADQLFTKWRRKAPEFIRGDISRRSLQTFLSGLIGWRRYDICRELAEGQEKDFEQQQNV